MFEQILLWILVRD